MSHYEAREGRGVWRDGMPFVFVERVTNPITGKGARPADVDDFTARAVACVNALAGLDPAGLAGVLDFVARVVADSGATVCKGDNGEPELCGGLDPAILLDEFYRHGKRALAALRGKGG